MNIFACDSDSAQAARWLPDKLVVKMPLESAQILCTVLWNRGETAPYMPTHAKHPCVVWAGRTRGNWQWLVDHALALSDEYAHRYGKEHRSRAVIRTVAGRGPTSGDLEPFVLAMPEKFKQADAVQAYRTFVVAEKTRYATWKDPTRKPDWWRLDVSATEP